MTTNTNCGIVEKDELCSSNVEGHVGQNLVAFHTNVANLSSCQASCYSSEGCNYYTYHDSSDIDLPGACILLSNLLPPLKACPSCQTGVMDCSKRCFFLGGDHGEDEVIYGGVKIVDTHQTINVQPVALGVCQLVAVAVGGGGGGSSISYGGGGGSGYIEWKAENITGAMEVKITVGGEGQYSVMTSNGTSFLTAANGGRASSRDGGAGYSGGGGGGNTHPGSGGSDGKSGEYGSGSGSSYYGEGGSGSGLDVSSIPMEYFSLMYVYLKYWPK